MVRTNNQNRAEIMLNPDQPTSEETGNQTETGQVIREQKERDDYTAQESIRSREQQNSQQTQQGTQGYDARSLPPQVRNHENPNISGNMQARQTVRGPDQSAQGNRGDEFGPFATRGNHRGNTAGQLPQPVSSVQERPKIQEVIPQSKERD